MVAPIVVGALGAIYRLRDWLGSDEAGQHPANCLVRIREHPKEGAVYLGSEVLDG